MDLGFGDPIHHRCDRKPPNYRIHWGGLDFCCIQRHFTNSHFLPFATVFAYSPFPFAEIQQIGWRFQQNGLYLDSQA